MKRALFAALALVAACTPRAKREAEPIAVRVLTARAEPLKGVELVAAGRTLAQTGEDGRATVMVDGAPGESFDVEVRCPSGFEPASIPLTLRRVGAAGAAPAEHAATCRATRHTLVVAVRAEGGADLPVLYLGREIARTDAAGAATLEFEMNVSERIELTLATDEKATEGIHPRNPARSFEMGDDDDLQAFDVTFKRDPKKPKPVFGRQGPVEIR